MPQFRSTNLLLALIPVVLLWVIAAVLAYQAIGRMAASWSSSSWPPGFDF